MPLLFKDLRIVWVSTLLVFVFLYNAPEVSGAMEESIHLDAQFKEKEWAPYQKKGTASISGQAFLTTMGEEARYNPGGLVILLPVTVYSQEWFEKVRPFDQNCNGIPAGPVDSIVPACRRHLGEFIVINDERLLPYLRQTRMNPNGHFWFYQLPPGKYYILSAITWHYQASVYGGIATAYVEVGANESVSNLIVTSR